MHCGLPGSSFKLSTAWSSEDSYSTRSEGGNKMVISFTSVLLDILRHNIPSSMIELENSLDDSISTTSRQALEWRILISKSFIEEWEWRLSILQHLLPLSERQWRWKEALTVLRAAPSKLLNLWVLPISNAWNSTNVQLHFCFCISSYTWKGYSHNNTDYPFFLLLIRIFNTVSGPFCKNQSPLIIFFQNILMNHFWVQIISLKTLLCPFTFTSNKN